MIGGYEDGTIRPKNSATRAEVATMIKRFKSYLKTADIDTSKALANAKSYTLSGDALKKVLDNTQVRATVQEDGTVKFTTFTESGRPVIRVYNTLTNALNFSDYCCAVIDFEANINGNYVITNLGYVEPGAAQGSKSTNIKVATSMSENKILLDYTNYLHTLNPGAENNNLVLVMMPWGEVDVKFTEGNYFIIKSVTFFDSVLAAQAYVG